MKKYINWDKAFDIVCIGGIVFLASHNCEGWGWLIFILFVKNA